MVMSTWERGRNGEWPQEGTEVPCDTHPFLTYSKESFLATNIWSLFIYFVYLYCMDCMLSYKIPVIVKVQRNFWGWYMPWPNSFGRNAENLFFRCIQVCFLNRCSCFHSKPVLKNCLVMLNKTTLIITQCLRRTSNSSPVFGKIALLARQLKARSIR